MNIFDSIAEKSYAYVQNEYEKSLDWRFVKELYETKFPAKGQSMIPKIIHQIWLGSPIPEVYKKLGETWQKYHPDWQYKLWTMENIGEVDIMQKTLFNQAKNWGMKSDILRYSILKQFGGLYVDTDFECVKPFDDLMGLSFFTGVGFDTQLQLYIGLIASTPEHPVLEHCLNTMNKFYTGSKGSVISEVTGANHFTRAFLKVARFLSRLEKNHNMKSIEANMVAFPTDYFYPFPNNMRGKEDDPYKYVTEYTYAIHHWAVSWIKLNKK